MFPPARRPNASFAGTNALLLDTASSPTTKPSKLSPTSVGDAGALRQTVSAGCSVEQGKRKVDMNDLNNPATLALCIKYAAQTLARDSQVLLSVMRMLDPQTPDMPAVHAGLEMYIEQRLAWCLATVSLSHSRAVCGLCDDGSA